MNLDEFIKETLIQISSGIESANAEPEPARKKDDGTQLPKLFLLRPGQSREQGEGVHFDVAVTTKAEKSGKGGAKVSLAVVQADMGGEGSTAHESVSRISFSVTINQWHG